MRGISKGLAIIERRMEASTGGGGELQVRGVLTLGLAM